MRKLATLLLAGLLLGLVTAPASARLAGEHPGCKGIDQAMSKASAKGQEALTVVAAKFACGPVVPDPVDTVACPEGQTSISRWTYVGSQTGPLEHGYPTWIGEWTLASGSGAGPVLNARPDGGGFYWEEAVEGAVRSIVLQSATGEVVTVTQIRTDSGDPGSISQNWFVDRTGINLVNFCG